MVKPATPASASWTTEIWPTKPTMTTSERQMTTPSSELIRDCRKSYGKTIRQTTPTTSGERARTQQPLRAGHDGKSLLDELAAAGQARPAQEQGDAR